MYATYDRCMDQRVTWSWVWCRDIRISLNVTFDFRMNRDMQIRNVREMRAGESAIVGFFFCAEWDVQFFCFRSTVDIQN